MLTEEDLHIISGLCILAAALVSVFLSLKLKGNIRKLATILSVFIVTHMIYHITGALGMDFLSGMIFKPLSYSVLIIFGLYYIVIKKKMKVEKNG